MRNESECKEEVLHLPLNLTNEINVLSGKSLVKHNVANSNQAVGREVRPTKKLKAETTALIQGGGLINFIVKEESKMYIQTTGTTKWNPKCFGELEDYGQRMSTSPKATTRQNVESNSIDWSVY